MAQNERENIRSRQAEGIAAAKGRGVRFGRKIKPLPDNFLENCDLWRNGQISGLEAAKRCRMPQSTFTGKLDGFGKMTLIVSNKVYFWENQFFFL